MALGLMPAHALLNDVNAWLVNFYSWLQRGLSLDGIRLANNAATYYTNRAWFNALVKAGHGDTAAAAGLFYFLTRTCYAGRYRFNATGGFSASFGLRPRVRYRIDFSAYQRPLAAFTFTCRDFQAVPIEPGDFIYADPPFDVALRKYTGLEFRWSDQVRAARWLARHPGPVVVSNAATARIVALYQDLGFTVRLMDAPSPTNGTSRATEVLATRNV
jgi:DNA adenine methylase